MRDTLGRYAVAIAAVLLTLAVKVVVGIGSEHPFVLLPAAVVLAAWYGGLGPGLLATILVAAASVYFFLPPIGPGSEPADLIGVAGLLVTGTLVAFLTAGLRAARGRAETDRAASNVAHREAAFALAVRDEMLTRWRQQLQRPVADIEAQARAAVADLEREGYAGAAGPKVRKLADEASQVVRATAEWDLRHSTNEAPR